MDLDAALAAVRAGDREAFASVVDATERRLRAFLAFRAPHRELVDEVAQQAYIPAIAKLGAYALGTSFLGWLKRIALNHLQNELRRRQRAGSVLERLDDLLAPEAAAEAVEIDEREERLARCLATLGEDARRLLDWRYRDRLTPAQIAERLGKLAGSVRVSLTRLRQSLHACLERAHG